MISLVTILWIMIGFFAVIGMQRDWTREVIATAGLILALFTINQFMPFLFQALGNYNQPFTETIWRREIFVLSGTLLFIAFISYAGPTVAGSRLAQRLRIRDSVQDKFLGLIVGAVNGYLMVGTLLSFLENRITPEGWLPTTPAPYPFSNTVLIRTESIDAISSYLPIPLLTQNPFILPILLVVVLLFVLAVML